MLDLKQIIQLLNQNIKSLFSDFCGVYLYGSYASKNNSQNSDIDI